MKRVVLYTDGACSYNPGPGGWGAILLHQKALKELSGGEPETTNNRMELTAIIKGLQALKEICIVDVYSDSAYVINAFIQSWTTNWINNNWKTSDKKPVLNQDLWKQLIELTKQHRVNWHKIKGHSSNIYNNRCDELARNEVQKIIGEKK
ncbi:MAG: ribonuclease HI [Clostridia bacterium]|nr:ribonuclease HI [Clostridia bacterium]